MRGLPTINQELLLLRDFYEAVTAWLDAHPHDDFSMQQKCVKARRAIEDFYKTVGFKP